MICGLPATAPCIDRFHTSLVHIGDRKRVRSKDEFAADLAARTVKISPFEITYSRLGSFPGVPKKDRPLEHPLVLLADEGPVMELYAALSAGLRKFRYLAPENFRPHLTLSYNRQFLPARQIEPITFLVREFVLVAQQAVADGIQDIAEMAPALETKRPPPARKRASVID